MREAGNLKTSLRNGLLQFYGFVVENVAFSVAARNLIISTLLLTMTHCLNFISINGSFHKSLDSNPLALSSRVDDAALAKRWQEEIVAKKYTLFLTGP